MYSLNDRVFKFLGAIHTLIERFNSWSNNYAMKCNHYSFILLQVLPAQSFTMFLNPRHLEVF